MTNTMAKTKSVYVNNKHKHKLINTSDSDLPYE